MTTAELVTERAILICHREHGRGLHAQYHWNRGADQYCSKARTELAREQDSYLSRLPDSARQNFMAWYEWRMEGRNPTDALVALAIRTATEGPYEHGLLIAEVFGDDDASEAADVIEVILADLDRDAEAAGEIAQAGLFVSLEPIIANFAGMGDPALAGMAVAFVIVDRTFELHPTSGKHGRAGRNEMIGLLVEQRP